FSLSLSDRLSRAWSHFKRQAWFWAGLALMVLLTSYLFGRFRPEPSPDLSPSQLALVMLEIVVQALISLGLIGVGLKAVRGVEVAFNDFVAFAWLIPRYIGASLLYALPALAVALMATLLPNPYLVLPLAAAA